MLFHPCNRGQQHRTPGVHLSSTHPDVVNSGPISRDTGNAKTWGAYTGHSLTTLAGG